jgi:hypothetical protein
MQTLSYGFKKPQSGDLGSVYFPALENNFQQLNDHDHDGTDSAKLPTSSLTAQTGSILAASWVSLGGGNYRQLVTLAGTLQYDNVVASFRNSSTGDYLNLTVEKASATTYYVYINDNSVSLTAYYGI